MVSAVVVIALALVATGEPDSARSALDEARLEDALLEGELEPGDLERERDARDQATALRASLRWAPGAMTTRLRATRGALAGDVLLVREAGEPRAIDDVFAAITARLGTRTVVTAGWLAPRLGEELVLGRRRTFSERPFAPRARDALRLDALTGSAPSTAAAGVRGLALRRAWGAWSAALVTADTPRDARPSGEAWWPVASALHRTATEAARRAVLEERLIAAAFARGSPQAIHAWIVVARAWTEGERRAAPALPGSVGEAAAGVTRGGAACEIGAAIARAARLGVAFDAHGRARTRASWVHAEAATTAELAFASEASGFTPLLARAENLPRAHLAARVRTKSGRGRTAHTLALEAYAIERGPLERPRAGVEARLDAGRGVSLALARDHEPARTLVSARWSKPAARAGALRVALAAAGEWRFDPKGLARESWWLEARTRGPAGVWGELETRLASGRSGFAVVDVDAPFGGWTRRARGAIRTRLTLGRSGRVEPRASMAWLSDGVGTAVSGWCALEVALGPR